IVKMAEGTSKLIMAAWLGGARMREGVDFFNESGIPVYPVPEQAIRAFMTLSNYSKNLSNLFETPREIPLTFSYDREKLKKKYVEEIFPKSQILSENHSKQLINDYGIPSVQPMLAGNEDEAVALAEQKGYPVVLKISSPDIARKTDVGGVALNIENEEMLRASYRNILLRVATEKPDAKPEGITVQKMADTREAVELILGIKKDKLFGTVMLVGMGGTTAELFMDRRLEFPPLNEQLARQMLKSLKIYPLLTGYRGSKPKNIDKLIEVLIRLSYLAADYPEIRELDINPLIVTPEEVLALDARIVVDTDLLGKDTPAYSHLILRPYPERLKKETKLNDGTVVLLRPIKPEDEALWLEMLASCSKESIYHRFRYDFHFNSHEVATQFCYIDYDREMGIVAEIDFEGRKRLVGVGRLISDPDLEIAEYAVLITDAWQHKDLGKILTQYCEEIARMAGVKRLVAETTSDNKAMISVFRKIDFKVFFNEDGTVTCSKDL
ncbi:MAG: GNAT family N-acetyltransferase, partial [Bacteroidales bacterium]|nr:GNAT family N-acetyltransferase [Bacteroidales bacterium]